MNVVILDGDVSYPATSGKRLRTLNLMLALADRHRITYIARSEGNPDTEKEAEAFLRDHGVTPILVRAPLATKRGASFYARLAANLFSPLPYSVASHHFPAIREAMADHARNHPVDLYQLEFTGYLYALPDHHTPVVVQAHNVDTLIWQRYYETEKRWAKRWYIRGQWKKFHRFEREAFHRMDRVIAVSEPDAKLVREWFGVDRVGVVDNGVDTAHFEGVRPAPASRTILYLGALDWRPNLDAVIQLLDEVFPAVRRAIPEARLQIVGRSPSESLRQRARECPGVELHADVPDVRPYMETSAVMAVPLRIGGGSRLKILEALAARLPVVSTPVGAEGLELRDGEELRLADRSEEMARTLIDVLSHPDKTMKMVERGHTLAARRYDWKVLADRLDAEWNRARERGRSRGSK